MKQTLKYILERLVQIRKFAEDKHSVTIALASGVIIFFAGFINSKDNFIIFLSSLSIIFSLISVLSSFIALMAKRVKLTSRKVIEISDLLDYKTISKVGYENYLELVKKHYNFPSTYKFDDFDRDLAKQIVSTAKVVKHKFAYFNLALLFLGLSLIFGVIVVCILGGV